MDIVKLCEWLPNPVWDAAQQMGMPASENDVPKWRWHDFRERIIQAGGQEIMFVEWVDIPPDEVEAAHISPRAIKVLNRGSRQAQRQLLERYFDADTHDQAAMILDHAISSKTGFGLYLRGYHLSAMIGVGLSGDYAIAGKEEMATSVLMSDSEIQKAIGSLRFVIPVIGLRNPHDPMPIGEMPKLALSFEEWEATTRQLIHAATAILVVVDRPSPGLMSELRMIAECGCAGRCILIHYNKDTKLNADILSEMSNAQACEMRETEVVEWERLLFGFDEAINYPGDGFEAAIKQRIERLVSERDPGAGRPDAIALPPRPIPPQEDAEAAGKLGRKLASASAQHSAAGRFFSAEDVAYGILSLGYLADDERLRAIAYLELARIVGIGLREADEAVGLFERAYRLYSKLGVLDMAISCRQEQAVMLCLLKRYTEARACLQGLKGEWFGKLNNWASFCVSNALYEVELAFGEQQAGGEAWREAIGAYQHYRRGGGIPRRIETLAVAQFTGMMKSFATLGIHRLDDESVAKKMAADHVECSALKHMRPKLFEAIGRWLSGEIKAESLLEETKGLDEYYEVHLMMHTLNQGL